jgi:hypothetical protein
VLDHAHAHTVVALGQPTLHHHGWSAYDEILRVPLVIAQPGTLPAARVDQQVSLVALEPTLRELVHLPPRPGARGRSLSPLWRGAHDERPAFVEGQDVRALRAGGWLYLRRSDGRLIVDGRPARRDEELYDLLADPTQHHDLMATAPPALARLRDELARLAPVLPEVSVPVVHLHLAPDARPHVISGTVRTEGALSVRAVTGGAATAVDAHTLRVSLRAGAAPAELELAIDPPTADLALTLDRDGTPVGANELLLGPFGLPLLAGGPPRLDGERLAWLDAARPPVEGHRGELLLWRDPSRAATPLLLPAHANDEVGAMMRRWGYAQGGKDPDQAR